MSGGPSSNCLKRTTVSLVGKIDLEIQPEMLFKVFGSRGLRRGLRRRL